jgi:hypothetical protein
VSRPEDRHSRFLSAITLMQTRGSTMVTLRTSTNLRKFDARRLMKGGFEIEYIETLHLESGDQSLIVWTRPARLDDIPESEIPY